MTTTTLRNIYLSLLAFLGLSAIGGGVALIMAIIPFYTQGNLMS